MTQVWQEARKQIFTYRDKIDEIYLFVKDLFCYSLNLFVIVFAIQQLQKILYYKYRHDSKTFLTNKYVYFLKTLSSFLNFAIFTRGLNYIPGRQS